MPAETYNSVETDSNKKCFIYVKDLLGWKDFIINRRIKWQKK